MLKKTKEDEYKPELPASLLMQKPATIEDLRFVFSQVEKRVKETSDDGDKINSKSLTIIGVCLTLMTGLIGYVAANLKNPYAVTGATIYLIFSLWNVCCILKGNIYPIKYRSVGSYPSDLMIDRMFESLEGDESAEYRMIYSEILEYEERVMLNRHNNDKRNDLIKKSYDRLYQIPLFTAIAYAVLALTSLIFGFNLS